MAENKDSRSTYLDAFAKFLVNQDSCIKGDKIACSKVAVHAQNVLLAGQLWSANVDEKSRAESNEMMFISFLKQLAK